MRLLRIRQVLERTGLSRRSLYVLMSEGTFPRQVELGKRAVAWPEEDVERWIKSRIAARDKQVAA